MVYIIASLEGVPPVCFGKPYFFIHRLFINFVVMSFVCANYCQDNSFLSALLRYNLIKGPHVVVESPKESLIECFASISTRQDISEKVDKIIREDFRIPRQARTAHDAGKVFEYGVQANLLTESSCPNVALISALSCLYKLEVYVVCSKLPMRFLRIDGNNGEFDVLKFKCFDEDSDSETEISSDDPPRRLIIGMVAMGIYHCIVQPENHSPTWDLISQRAIPVTLDTILRNDSESESDDELNPEQALADELIGNEDPNLEHAPINVSPSGSGNDSTTDPASDSTPSISIQEYLRRFCRNTRDGVIIDPEAYNNNFKIDVDLTSREDLRNMDLARLER